MLIIFIYKIAKNWLILYKTSLSLPFLNEYILNNPVIKFNPKT